VSNSLPSARQRWRSWHRRIGVIAAGFVLIIATTGLLLNHTEDLGLDERYLQSSWLLSWYGIEESAAVQVYQLGDLWVAYYGEMLFANGEQRVHCSELRDVQWYHQEVLAVCADKGWLLSPAGELLEPWPSSQPLPTGISRQHQRDASQLPAQQWAQIQAQSSSPHSLHWERVLLDLHSGRLFGAVGVWVFDVAALLFIFLALSGVWVWAGKRNTRE